jgi:hypothetical protein
VCINTHYKFFTELQSKTLANSSRKQVIEKLFILSGVAKVETRLEDMAVKFGLSSWKELEDFFKEGKDLPEVDLAWAEYLYLKNRRENLLKEREEVLTLLS